MKTRTLELASQDWLSACPRPSPQWQKVLDQLEVPANQALQLKCLLLFEFEQDSEQVPLFVLRAAIGVPLQERRVSLDKVALALLNQPLQIPLAIDEIHPLGGLKPLISVAAQQQYISALVAPIYYKSRLAGCLVGYSPQPKSFTPAEFSIFSLFASFITTAIENSRLRGETVFRLSEALSLQTISSTLVEERNLNAILAVIINEAIRLTNSSDALVLLLEEGGEWFQVCARKGHDVDGIKNGRLLVKGSLNGQVVQTGQPLVSHDAMTDPRANQARAYRLNVRTVAIAPLKIRDITIGTLAIHNKHDGYFGHADVEVLCSFANQVTIAIDNARLFNELLLTNDKIKQTAQELQELLVQTMKVQEDERRRIAADIHDRVVPLIIGTLYEVEAYARYEQPQNGISGQLGLIQQLLNEAIAEIRSTIYALWPATLDKIGLLPTLAELLDHQKKSTTMVHTLRTYGTPYELPPPMQVAVYRIVQEALTNIRQHAQATRVDVSIRFSSQGVRIVIRDNGQGFNVQSKLQLPLRHHFGLISMRERAHSIGGRLFVESVPGEGSRIILEIPLNK